MMMTFITRRGEGQGKTKKGRKATKSEGSGLEEGASRALMQLALLVRVVRSHIFFVPNFTQHVYQKSKCKGTAGGVKSVASPQADSSTRHELGGSTRVPQAAIQVLFVKSCAPPLL